MLRTRIGTIPTTCFAAGLLSELILLYYGSNVSVRMRYKQLHSFFCGRGYFVAIISLLTTGQTQFPGIGPFLLCSTAPLSRSLFNAGFSYVYPPCVNRNNYENEILSSLLLIAINDEMRKSRFSASGL